MLTDIVKCINQGAILYDNENLSIPFFRFNNGKEELVFFTYVIKFNIEKKQNETVLGRCFCVTIEDNLIIEEIELSKDIPYMRDKVFTKLPELEEDTCFDYDEILALSDNMLNCNYSFDSVKLFALTFEKYTSEYTKQIYMYIGEEYFNKLNEIVSI